MLFLFVSKGFGEQSKPVAWWSFDTEIKQSVKDRANSIEDSIVGNFRIVRGVSGQALKLDGYTTVVMREASATPKLEAAFTIEAWVAIAAYPWSPKNWGRISLPQPLWNCDTRFLNS
jgi:hypothetical protein